MITNLDGRTISWGTFFATPLSYSMIWDNTLIVKSKTVVLHRSDLENIDLDVKETYERSCMISGSSNCSIDLKSLTEELIMPHGICKVYRGKPQQNMWFSIRSGQDTSEYDIFISDSASSNSFQVKLNLSTFTVSSMKL